MRIRINKRQKEIVSSFFMNISVAWFVGLFVVPTLSASFDVLTFIKYLVNMIGTFTIAVMLVKESV